VFDSQSALIHLSLRNNLIRELDQNTFTGLDQLETLDLEANLIQQIGSQSFARFRRLHDL
jgi:Leucine-rich repeat (LRR) protein